MRIINKHEFIPAPFWKQGVGSEIREGRYNNNLKGSE